MTTTNPNPKLKRHLFAFNLQTLLVLAIAAVLCLVGLVVREAMALFRERDLASMLPSWPPIAFETIVLLSGVVIVFGAWSYYRRGR